MFAPSFASHPLATEIDRVRHHTFMKLALPHLIVGLLTAVLIFFLFKDYAIASADIIWLAANTVLLVCTLVFYTLYYFRGHVLTISQWGKVTFIVSLLWGVCWSLPPFILLGTDNVLYIGILVTFVISMSSVPAPVLVHYPGAYFVFITLPLGSLTLKTSMVSIEHQEIIQFLPPFLWLSLLIYGWDLHKTVIESIRLRLENELALGEARQAGIAKSQFIAAASHDIRQPLQAAVLSLDAIKASQGKKLDLLLPNLEKSVDSISDLVTGLLDISRLDSGSIEVRSEHLALSSVIDKLKARNILVAKDKGLSLIFNSSLLSLEDTAIFCDPILLDRVLNNLVSNGIRYTDSGAVSVEVSQLEDTIVFSIKDTGIGIASEQLEDIFDEFYQVDTVERDHKIGLGLGLSIVKRLCHLQSWELQVESVPGKGSCFSVAVPVGCKSAIRSVDNKPVGSLSRLTALVIDDNIAVRESLSDMLSAWQCNVLVADSAGAAVRQLQQHKNLVPDIVISDYQLANNENGIEAIDEIKKHTGQEMATVLMTGDANPEKPGLLIKSGIKVMHKPVRPGHLRTFIHRHCLQEI